ncbi:MAG: hotdog domain-containing protein [Candidatus Melainabacteria bacterium]|nr:hotdog domain-containing protein [Candidatus Melainabacteria bacterium]
MLSHSQEPEEPMAPVVYSAAESLRTSASLNDALTSVDGSPEGSRFCLTVPTYPSHTDQNGFANAGFVLELMDVGGCIPAKRHVGFNYHIVTACQDRTDFLHPVRPWDILNVEAQLTRVWGRSMESRVCVWVWSFETGQKRVIANAYQVNVVLDKNLQKANPDDIPPLLSQTEKDVREAEAADRRRQYRQQEDAQAIRIPFTAEDQPLVRNRILTPADANTIHHAFGGILLAEMHQAAWDVAQAHASSGCSMLCVRQERTNFLKPAPIGSILVSRAQVVKSWNTSIDVQVDLDAFCPQTQQVIPVASSLLVFVQTNQQGIPTPVTPWVPQTHSQERRAELAVIRRQLREQEQGH